MLPFEFLMRSGYIFVVIAFPNCVTLSLVFNFTLTGFLDYCPARGLGSNHPRARLGAEASSCRTAQREASGTEHHSPIITVFSDPSLPEIFERVSFFAQQAAPLPVAQHHIATTPGYVPDPRPFCRSTSRTRTRGALRRSYWLH